ncbi:unnamed protein product [Closterium sp. Yama58-4]|nr:unnamed protein product [Closterium sp. Yama58-4]
MAISSPGSYRFRLKGAGDFFSGELAISSQGSWRFRLRGAGDLVSGTLAISSQAHHRQFRLRRTIGHLVSGAPEAILSPSQGPLGHARPLAESIFLSDNPLDNMAFNMFLVAVIILSFGAAASADERCTPAQLKKCDFVVKGSEGAVPTMTVEAVNGNRILSNSPILHKSGQAVNAAYSSFCSFLNEKKPTGACGNYFFFMTRNTKLNTTSVIASRMIPKQFVPSFKGKCVQIRIDSVQLSQTGWLNNGDSKKGFPQARRCVLINTALGSRGERGRMAICDRLVVASDRRRVSTRQERARNDSREGHPCGMAAKCTARGDDAELVAGMGGPAEVLGAAGGGESEGGIAVEGLRRGVPGKGRNAAKRSAKKAKDYGLALVELKGKELQRVVRWMDLPEETLEAVQLAQAGGRTGWRRQLGFIGGLLRGESEERMDEAIAAAKSGVVPSFVNEESQEVEEGMVGMEGQAKAV